MTRLILLFIGNITRIKYIKYKQTRMLPTNIKSTMPTALVYKLQRSLLLAYTQFLTNDCVYNMHESLILLSSPY